MRAETTAAIEAVRAAQPLLLERRGADLWQEKDRLDYVTGTDTAVERLLIERLGAAFPDCGVLGEETGHQGSREVFWVLDPICGTTNYAIGLPIYNVNVALVEHGQVTAAVVLEPAASRLYWAERGRGAYTSAAGEEWQRMQVSGTPAVVSIDFGHRTSSGEVDAMLGVMSRILRERLWGVRVMVSSLVLAYLADGRLAAHVVDAVSAWDACAGALLCEEAGGIVTGFDGQPWRWDSSQLVCAATPALHSKLLELLASPN
ncbi:MAG TPA: inositol monophosphatase, partial [Chloroflexota bacterium]|nr:inositol monophosphatase [Chloroflexota bacterium]